VISTRPDWLTVIAIAVVVYCIVSLVHEGLGHGGACLAMGGRPQLITSMQFQGDKRGVSSAGLRFIAAGGTIANVAAAGITGWLLRRRRRKQAGASWFFLWLFTTINLLQATGYFLYSGVAGIGDWTAVVRGFAPAWVWRAGLIIVGAVTYWFAAKWAMDLLGQRLSSPDSARVAEANRYTLVAYAGGALLSIAAGLFEPGGALVVLISGAAASLGGTSALAWGPQLLHDQRLGASVKPPLIVGRDWRWIVAGAVVVVVVIFVLGAGVRLTGIRTV
jgi:hypothetical protein